MRKAAMLMVLGLTLSAVAKFSPIGTHWVHVCADDDGDDSGDSGDEDSGT